MHDLSRVWHNALKLETASNTEAHLQPVAVFISPHPLQVASWGGYSFIINLVPIHVLACIFTGQLSSRLYVAYAPFVIIGTIEAGNGFLHLAPAAMDRCSGITSNLY